MTVCIQRLDEIARRIRAHHHHQSIAHLNQRLEVKLAINDRDYPWHHHPNSDELLIVIEGVLRIDLEDGRTEILRHHDSIFIPAGMVHRTRPDGRAVNLVVEDAETETRFVEPPRVDVTCGDASERSGDSQTESTLSSSRADRRLPAPATTPQATPQPPGLFPKSCPKE